MTIQDVESSSKQTEADLKKLNKDTLVSICKNKGYKATGNISDLISRIMALDKYRISHKVDMMNAIKSAKSSGSNKLHDFYRDHFNLVDLQDRVWYEIVNKAQVNNWKGKFFECVMKSQLVNAFAYMGKTHDFDWVTFRGKYQDWLFAAKVPK